VKQYEAKPIRTLARSVKTRFGGFFHGRFLRGRNGLSRRRSARVYNNIDA